jgi:hypothetical protein
VSADELKARGKSIDETNFRLCAQDAIAVYHKQGRILDALVWARIVALYDSALDAAEARASKGGPQS